MEQPRPTEVGEELEPAEIAQLLARVPGFEDNSVQPEFRRPDSAVSSPVVPETIEAQWPPDLSVSAPQVAKDEPLQVEFVRPHGDVEPPFEVAVTFNRSVASVGALADLDVSSVTITPPVEGKWRWLGTRTLAFSAEESWPGSTRFEVEVPSGIGAFGGPGLQKGLRFEFTTLLPKVQRVLPWRANTADSVVSVIFDQPVDDKIGEYVTLHVDGEPLAIEQVRGERLRELVSGQGRAIEENRIVAFVPLREYEEDVEITVAIKGPVQSLEGPLVATIDHSHTFTYQPPRRW